jgi:hypothetical protein
MIACDMFYEQMSEVEPKPINYKKADADHHARWRRRKLETALKSDDPRGNLQRLADFWGKRHRELLERQGHPSGVVWGHYTAFKSALDDLSED